MSPIIKKPAHSIRYGVVEVAVWKHATPKSVNHSISMQRRFLRNGKWESTSGFFSEDLLVLAKALTEAHSWIHTQRSVLRTEGESSPESTQGAAA